MSMTLEFRLPDLGENIESGDVVSLLVKEGDLISPNQPVLEIETGKATVELPCPIGGRIEKIHVRPGQTVPVGCLLLTLAETAADAAAPLPAAPPAAPPLTAATPAEAVPPAPARPAQVPLAAQDPGQRPWQPPRAAAAPGGGSPATPAVEPVQPSEAEALAPIARPAAVRAAEAASPPAAQERPLPAAAALANPLAGLETAPAGPATRRLARELGIDLRLVRGTGPGGRITEDDVKQAARQAAASAAAPTHAQPPTGHDPWGPIRAQPLPAIRRTIAQNMVRSVAAIPQVTNFDDADVTELERIRKGSMADYVQGEVKLTLLPFVIKAVAHALRLHPAMNASLEMETGQVIYKQYINIGVAVDTERGLVVPVLRHVDRLSIPQIAAALADLAAKARANKFTPDELRGGTFTISNLGAVGGSYSTPIINPPEVGILLTGRAREAPVVLDGQIAIRLMLPLSLTYDHRLIDGAAAARFLNEVKSYLQIPGRLLLAP